MWEIVINWFGIISKNYSFQLVLIYLVLILFTGCNNNQTGPSKQISGALINLVDISCTEAWLTINKGDAPSGTKITLLRNDKEALSFYLSGNDTTICDDSLASANSYKYQVILKQPAFSETLTNALSVKSLPVTNHNINWEIVYIGDYSSSYFKEVAIINENDIWAVGEFYLNDSTGQHEVTAYNAIHWDGNKWKPYRVPVKCFVGSSVIITDGFPITSIAVLKDNSVCFISQAGGITTLINNNWNMLQIPIGVFQTVTLKSWVNKKNEIYFASEYGTIWYYDQINWKELQCGTSTSINDIWGYTDYKTGKDIIYGAVSTLLYGGDRKIIKIIEKTKVDSIIIGNNRNIESVWTLKGVPIFVCGDGIFENRKGYWEEIKAGNFYTKLIRGTSLNDIFICGHLGFLAHYNGESWKQYNEVYTGAGHFNSFSIKDNIIVAVGDNSTNRKAMIAIGKR